ncbi:MAG TPA: hypothetical protein VKR57_04220 [Terriglobales bacterium]|nr:hypothetical protein [Terriglobales bacterium]
MIQTPACCDYLLKPGRFAHFFEDSEYFQSKIDDMWNKWLAEVSNAASVSE